MRVPSRGMSPGGRYGTQTVRGGGADGSVIVIDGGRSVLRILVSIGSDKRFAGRVWRGAIARNILVITMRVNLFGGRNNFFSIHMFPETGAYLYHLY